MVPGTPKGLLLSPAMTGPISVWLTAPATPNCTPVGRAVSVVVLITVDEMNGATSPAERYVLQSDSYEIAVGGDVCGFGFVTAAAGVTPDNPITAQTPALRASAAPPEATLLNLVSLKVLLLNR